MTVYSSPGKFPIPVMLEPGKYLLECWGAAGGRGQEDGVLKYEGGRGAYASGILTLYSSQQFFLYIGTKGQDSKGINTTAEGGWNGGGNGGTDIGSEGDDGSGAGGGATDIRYEENNLQTRFIVAAGGSGSVYKNEGAPGGDINGYHFEAYHQCVQSLKTNQTAGNAKGFGANGGIGERVPASGGGGGYYGGAQNEYHRENYFYHVVSDSGSSYISGYPNLEKVPNFILTNTKIKNGMQQMPPYNNSAEPILGNPGDGKIRITRLFICTKKQFYQKGFLFVFFSFQMIS